MKTRWFRLAAIILGLLGILSLVVQVGRDWPPNEAQLSFFILQAAVLFAFLSYGLSIGPLATPRPAGVNDARPGVVQGSSQSE